MSIATGDKNPAVTTTPNATVVPSGPEGVTHGESATAKVSFHGTAPVVQRSNAAQAAVATTAPTNTTPYGFATQAQAQALITLVNELRATLVEKGLIKGG